LVLRFRLMEQAADVQAFRAGVIDRLQKSLESGVVHAIATAFTFSRPGTAELARGK
jgi:hypothetical protein